MSQTGKAPLQSKILYEPCQISTEFTTVNTCLLRETNGLVERAVGWSLETCVQVLTLFFICVTLDKSIFEAHFLCLKRRDPNSCLAPLKGLP